MKKLWYAALGLAIIGAQGCGSGTNDQTGNTPTTELPAEDGATETPATPEEITVIGTAFTQQLYQRLYDFHLNGEQGNTLIYADLKMKPDNSFDFWLVQVDAEEANALGSDWQNALDSTHIAADLVLMKTGPEYALSYEGEYLRSEWSYGGGPYSDASPYGDGPYGAGGGAQRVQYTDVTNDAFSVEESAQWSGTQLYQKAQVAPLTLADVEGMTKDQLALLRNEIFARHGHAFKTDRMVEHFGAQAWYESLGINASDYLNDMERANVAFLLKQEEK